MKDGSHIAISIEYKPRSTIEGNDKVGSYFYIVRLRPKSPFDPKTDIFGGFEFENLEHAGYFTSIKMSFYDRKGYSLFTSGRQNTLTLGGRGYSDEENQIDGGWEWIGRFYEDNITIENFRDIYSVKVFYAK